MKFLIVKIFLVWAWTAFVCFCACYIFLPIILKICDLCSESGAFRVGMWVFFALFFGLVGVMQWQDFFGKNECPDLSIFFPVFFLLSGVFVYFIFLEKKKKKKSNCSDASSHAQVIKSQTSQRTKKSLKDTK